MKSRKVVASIIGIICVCMLSGALVAGAAVKPGVMEISEMMQRHPRKAPLLIYRDGKIWVIGGKAYYSHFTKWGQDGHPEYNALPNVEYIDLKTNQVVYTDLALQTEAVETGDFYHAIPFYTSEDSMMIYIAGDEWLAKLDLTKFDAPQEAVIDLDPGEDANWEEASWGKMTVNGQDYITLVGEDGASFFDIEQETFVELDGMDADLPEDMASSEGFGGCVIDNVFYIFGGEAPDGSTPEAWAFDPAQPGGSQWTRNADMPVSIEGPMVVTFDGKAYIMGGDAAGTYYKTVFAYDPVQNSYARKTDLPFPMTGHSALLVDDAIWLPSGYTWGLEEEGKYGFRMHPPTIVTYYPANDESVYELTGRTSISGEYMNMNISWSDADHVTGESQTMTVNWTASSASTKGVLLYRKKGDDAFESVEAAGKVYAVAMDEAKSYSATLTGLLPDTEYEYKVVSEGTTIESDVYTLKTQPAAPETVSFVVYGDTKAQYDINHELNCDILDIFNKNGHIGWYGMLGDFGDIGAFVEWNAWFNYSHDDQTCTKDLAAQYPLVPVHGNHESFARSFFDNVSSPSVAMTGWPELNNAGEEEYWYSFNYGKLHVVVLTSAEDNDEDWFTTDQFAWLEADLAKVAEEKAAGNLDWTIVLFHHSPFTSGEHFEDQADYGMFEDGSYIDVIEKSGAVDAVFAAHDHDYERTKNIRGYRWMEENADGDPAFYTVEGATVEEESGQFGTATQGQGIIWVTAGGAGAGQRDMFEFDELGESSHIAFRKPAPEREEEAGTHPVYHYVLVTASPTEFKIETFEKSIAYLPAWEGADDDFTGLLDSVTIRR